jgi:carbamoyl-phosphate synthase large subunit
METKTILVTGIGGNVGQGILRNIHSINRSVNIIGVDISSFTAGSYLCNKTYQVPYAVAPEFISIMKKIVTENAVDLIIPSTDNEVYELAMRKGELPCKIASSSANISKIYLDKYESYLYHQELKIPFAQSWLPSLYDNSCKEIIAKPREGRGSRGVILNPDSILHLGNDYIIQPLYKGIEITTAVYVTKANKLHGHITMERELTNGTTSKSKVVFDYDTAMEKIINLMIKPGFLCGSFNIQSIVLDNNEIMPFEVNCRISGTNSIRHNLGFQDVKYTLQEYLWNEYPDQPQPIKGVATRILLDVIYPNTDSFDNINGNFPQPNIY